MTILIENTSNNPTRIDRWVFTKKRNYLKAEDFNDPTNNINLSQYSIHFSIIPNKTNDMFIDELIEKFINTKNVNSFNCYPIKTILKRYTLREFLDHIEFLKERDKTYILLKVG